MSDIEKEFFEAFEIEPKEPCKYGYGCGHAKPCCPRKKCLPPITSDIVLGLIKIATRYFNKSKQLKRGISIAEYYEHINSNWAIGISKGEITGFGKDVVQAILKLFIKLDVEVDDIQNEVKALFKC